MTTPDKQTRTRAPVDTRAAALSDLQRGDQPAAVAARYTLDPATVRQWASRARRKGQQQGDQATTRRTSRSTPAAPEVEQPAGGGVGQHPPEVAPEIAALAQDCLAARLRALTGIAHAAACPEWLGQQRAGELAALLDTLDRSTTAALDCLTVQQGQRKGA